MTSKGLNKVSGINVQSCYSYAELLELLSQLGSKGLGLLAATELRLLLLETIG